MTATVAPSSFVTTNLATAHFSLLDFLSLGTPSLTYLLQL